MSTMLEHVQHEPDALEAGGVLLGRELLGTGDLVVDAVTEPMAEDMRTRVSFFRSLLCHQHRIFEAWQQSHGTRGYLGEWHTHPEPRPAPSVVDRRDWKRRLVEDRVDARCSLFLIMGTRALGAWLGDRRAETIRLLGYCDLPRPR